MHYLLVGKEEPITIGIEIELYTIRVQEKMISRSMSLPKIKHLETGGRFIIDKSIGVEYITKPFENITEAAYVINEGFRKYTNSFRKQNIFPLPVGGWNDRFAGTHYHIGFKENGLEASEAVSLANYIHDHIPFLIAVSANSAIWRRNITKYSSNRMLRVGDKYCIPVVKGELNRNHYKEMNFNPENKHKPSTLEIRVCDSNIPPYICTIMMILRVLASAWRGNRRACNSLTHETYLQSRIEAARKGIKARLYWNGKPVTVGEYLYLLINEYRDEVSVLSLPRDVVGTFNLLEKGWNNAEAIRHAAIEARERFGKDWEKDMTIKLASAMQTLLSGGTLEEYYKTLGIPL